MIRSSEPPILAKLEAARNCFGLNATVLPGLGTFRMGSRLRGLFEMSVAIGGTLLFCGALIQAVSEREEGMTLLAAFSPHFSKLTLGVFLVLGAWFSGVFYAKGLFRR
jgi:hypothetical protein